jgi:hypothetical protein
MKSIAKIGQRLISAFLVLVVSTLMFLTSPAMAAGSVTINRDNVESEVLKYDKTVIVLLISDVYSEDDKAKLKSEVEKAYGDTYKIAIGSFEENGNIVPRIPLPLVYPPFPVITAFKNGKQLGGLGINPSNPTGAFEYFNEQIANS